MTLVSELKLDHSFNAYQWLKGTSGQRNYQAAILLEQVKAFGLAGIADDEHQIISSKQRADTFRAIDLLFHRIPREVKREHCVSTTDPNLGYFWPGREGYREGAPENWKEFFRIGYREPSWKYPPELWLPAATLAQHLTAEETAFLDHFQKQSVYHFFDSLVNLSIIPLNALAHHHFGLGSEYFNRTRKVNSTDYKLVKDNTLQLLQYLTGINPLTGQEAQIGDPLAGEHKDSSTGTLGDVSHDPYHCLEVLTNSGEWVAPVLAKQDHFFFQFGKTYAALMVALAAQGTIDPERTGLIKATEHRVKRKNLSHQRPGIFLFNHPDLDMPIGTSTARGVLHGDLNAYISTAERTNQTSQILKAAINKL